MDVFLNGDSFNITAPVTLSDSSFFNNFPLSLPKGTTFTGVLFTFTVPLATSPGTYDGTLTLLGGPTGSSANALGTVNFAVTVPSAVPEPSTWLLLSTGLAGGLSAFRLRRHTA